MKRIFFFITTIALIACGKTQTKAQKTTSNNNNIPVITTDYIKKHTNYFTIADNNFQGNGKQILEDIVNTSQFLVYGENHGSEQTSIFNKAIMGLLKKADYKYFAIEVGPTSAKKLSELSSPAEKTVENLRTFNTKYSFKTKDDVLEPIPFFSSVSDAEFLQEARKNGMQLWGLDQEFYFGTVFLIDELLQSTKSDANFEALKSLYQKAKAAAIKHHMVEITDEKYDVFTNILKDKDVTNFFDTINKDNTTAQNIIADLKTSWNIYINWRRDSHADRISYMRNNFLKNYNNASKTEKLPKVYTKIGSLHARKTISNGAYDIGELTQSLAEENGTKATAISTWIPFEKDEEGKVTNNFKRYRGFKRYHLFFPLAKENEFAIINLKAIKEEINTNKIKLPNNGDYHKLRNLIYGYDYQIILPTDIETTPNRN